MNSFVRTVKSSLLRRVCLNKSLGLGARSLFNGQYLGVDVYLDVRESKKQSFGNIGENFMARMKQQLESASPSTLVFTEDLKAAMHIANEGNLDVCVAMMKRFHKQNKELRFGTFIFGPVFMRLLHHLNKADLALELMKDPDINTFFNQIRSYLVAMDLLFENGHYQEVLDLNDQLTSQQLIDSKYPRDTVLITLAACYKLNTPASLTYALDLISKVREAGSTVVRRSLHFAVTLALNQGKPDVAMELLSCLPISTYITTNNLKIITLAKIGRLDEALAVIRSKVEQDQPTQSMSRGYICQETLDALEKAIKSADDTELSARFEQLCSSLQQGENITSQTIDDFLGAPIAPRPEREFDDRNRFGYRQRPFGEEREQPFFRRRGGNIPFRNRENAFSGISSE